MKPIHKAFALMLGSLLLGAAPAYADPVTDWNEIAVAAVSAGRPGPIGIVDIALVQVAVHDAVQAIEQRFEPYHAEIAARSGARRKGRLSGAVAAAAHDVLVGMYPAQATTLDTTYYNYLADHGLASDPGILIGQQVAARILPLRRVNPNPLPPPFVGGTTVGTWRPTPSYLGNPPDPRAVLTDGHAVVGRVRSLHAHGADAFPGAAAAGAHQRSVHARLQRGQGDRFPRQHPANGRTNGSRVFLQRIRAGNVESRAAIDRRALSAQERATRRGSSRWRTSRPPMRSSPVGTARRTLPSGGR